MEQTLVFVSALNELAVSSMNELNVGQLMFRWLHHRLSFIWSHL